MCCALFRIIMSSTTVNDVRQILRKWDKGSKRVRESMLLDFIRQCESMTAPELEQQFHECASLFLARLTAWLRLSYMTNPYLELLLKAISVFVGATSGQHYLTEFLEVGGMLTLLEVISLQTSKERDKEETLYLLSTIIGKGRQYKEILCESFGTKLVAECLALSSSVETQESARNLLHQLCLGNPRYQSQVYKALISLLSSTSNEAQRMATYTLRQVQDTMGVVSASIVDPVLQLLKSLHLDLQEEALELLSYLVTYEEIQQHILTGLVGMLKVNEDGPIILNKTESTATPASLPVYIQQAAAAKAIRLLLNKHPDLGGRFLELRVVPHLLHAMGNTSFANAQKQASLALDCFLKSFSSSQAQMVSIVGKSFYLAFIKDPENFYNGLTPSQIDVLIGSLGQDKY